MRSACSLGYLSNSACETDQNLYQYIHVYPVSTGKGRLRMHRSDSCHTAAKLQK